ncbi:MAG: ATP-binding protein, partial [Bacteroidota bacterium]
MITRLMQPLVREMAGKMPVLSIMGPRQSGKTTLARSCFPSHRYLNAESPETQQLLSADPRGMLSPSDGSGVILDEVQRMPELMSWVQVLSDEAGKPGQYILTGSQNLLVKKGISQTLAGRVFISELLPLSMAELTIDGRLPLDPDAFILSGGYPRLFNAGIDPALFYPSYIQTYIERDVAGLVMPQNLIAFRRFIGLLAGRTGQLVNFSSLAIETGVDIKTIQAWCSLLQSAYLIFFLQPFHSNHSKRLVKTPKVYFHDTGVACSVLGIRSASDL